MNRRFAVLLGLTAASCVAAAFVACGNSSSGGGGSDAGSDHASGQDATAQDSSSGQDSSTKDSTASEGGGTEGGMSEGGEDANDGGGSCQLFDASALDDGSVQAGFLQVWQVYKCWKCHQNATDLVDPDSGAGILLNGNDAGLGDSGLIFPPNLTNSAQGLGCWTDQQIETAILQGKDLEGGALCPPMPAFGTAATTPGRPMDAGTAQEIIDYIRSLQASNKVVTDTTCPAADSGSDAAPDGPTDAGGQ
jgi:hypothetical protein